MGTGIDSLREDVRDPLLHHERRRDQQPRRRWDVVERRVGKVVVKGEVKMQTSGVDLPVRRVSGGSSSPTFVAPRLSPHFGRLACCFALTPLRFASHCGWTSTVGSRNPMIRCARRKPWSVNDLHVESGSGGTDSEAFMTCHGAESCTPT